MRATMTAGERAAAVADGLRRVRELRSGSPPTTHERRCAGVLQRRLDEGLSLTAAQAEWIDMLRRATGASLALVRGW